MTANEKLWVVLIALTFVALGLIIVAFSWSSRREIARLTRLWQDYSARHGDSVWQPGRFSFLGGGEVHTYAEMRGVRNHVPFKAQILVFDTDGAGKRQTIFEGEPAWLPDKSWIAIHPESERNSEQYASLDPALVAHRLVVYATPREAASVFKSAAGDKLLADFAALQLGTNVTASRNDAQAKHYSADQRTPRLSLQVPQWCVEPTTLDACIDLVTRLCRLPVTHDHRTQPTP